MISDDLRFDLDGWAGLMETVRLRGGMHPRVSQSDPDPGTDPSDEGEEDISNSDGEFMMAREFRELTTTETLAVNISGCDRRSSR